MSVKQKKGIGTIDITKLSNALATNLKVKKDITDEKYWSDKAKKISKKLSYHKPIVFNDLCSIPQQRGCFNNNNTRVAKNTKEHLLKFKNPIKLKKTDAQITRKIQFFPNQQQKDLFIKQFNAHNYIYNKTVEEINHCYNMYRENKETNELTERILESINDKLPKSYVNIRDAKIKEICYYGSDYNIRSRVVLNKDLLTEDNTWLKEIQSSSKQISTVKAFDAKKSNLELIKGRPNKYFKLHFRSKKYSDNIFYMEKKALVNGSIFPQQLRRDNIQESYDFSKIITKKKHQHLVQQSDGEFSIKQEKNGRYYICIVIKPKDVELPFNQKICALDPGVRTFQTMYSEDSVGEYGFNTSKKIYNLYRREDKLKSVLTKQISSKKRYKLKKRCAILRTKVKHVVADLHWQTANSLTKDFQVILLPIFGTKNMANKKKRKIGKTTTRLMLGLSHYSFQEKLLYKAKARGRTVIICKEHYTSKCCGKCGTLNLKLGSNKTFHCKSCDLKMDRDIHAARNVLIRNLAIGFLDML
jgi:transposase